MIERLHPKHETLTAGEWRQTQAKIDELVDAVNALSSTLEEVEDHLYGLEDDDDIGFTEDALNEDDDYWGNSLCHCGDVEEPHHHTSPAIKSTEESKAAILLNDLVDYCRRHPELRFWQALRSCSGYNYINGSHHGEADIFDGGITAQQFISQLEDMYYKQTKGPDEPEPLRSPVKHSGRNWRAIRRSKRNRRRSQSRNRAKDAKPPDALPVLL